VRAVRSVEHYLLRAPAQDRLDRNPDVAPLSGGDVHGPVCQVHRRIGNGGNRFWDFVFVLWFHYPMAGNEQRRQRYLDPADVLCRTSIIFNARLSLHRDCRNCFYNAVAGRSPRDGCTLGDGGVGLCPISFMPIRSKRGRYASCPPDKDALFSSLRSVRFARYRTGLGSTDTNCGMAQPAWTES